MRRAGIETLNGVLSGIYRDSAVFCAEPPSIITPDKSVLLSGEGAIHESPGKGTDGIGEALHEFWLGFVGGGPNAGHAVERATVVDDFAPGRSGFVPASVTGIGAKGEQES